MDYVVSEEDRFKAKRVEALTRFRVARDKYLRQAGWVPQPTPAGVSPLIVPVWWKDPIPEKQPVLPYQEFFREDQAVVVQEGRDNELSR